MYKPVGGGNYFLLLPHLTERKNKKKSPTERTIEDLKRRNRERIGFMAPFSGVLAGSESLGTPCYSQLLAAVAHTRNLCYSPPLVREAMLQVSYL